MNKKFLPLSLVSGLLSVLLVTSITSCSSDDDVVDSITDPVEELVENAGDTIDGAGEVPDDLMDVIVDAIPTDDVTQETIDEIVDGVIEEMIPDVTNPEEVTEAIEEVMEGMTPDEVAEVVDNVVEDVMVDTTATPNQLAFITDTDGGDTGELRLDLGSNGILPTGRISVDVSRTASSLDSFIALYGGSTSGDNALVELRLGEGQRDGEADGVSFDENFLLRNEGDAINSSRIVPPLVADQVYAIQIDWDTTTEVPEVQIWIDGTSITDSPFNSGGVLAEIENGVRNIQFRFGGSSSTAEEAEGFSVDNLRIYDMSTGTPDLIDEDSNDFESFTVGDVLNADNGFHQNSFQATVIAE